MSEGLDFADRSGRAVVVTGIPFAMKMDPKVRLKREFLDEQARSRITKHKVLTGEEWYVQQASRAVNQAVGRVIRHRNDYGAIILCDERFGQSGPQSQMSLWLRPYIKVVMIIHGLFNKKILLSSTSVRPLTPFVSCRLLLL